MSTVPSGYRFRLTDKELLDFLKQKSKGDAVPGDVVIERQIFGVCNKAPWQIFTDEDPWEICRTKDQKRNKWKTEGTIYVFTSLIKSSLQKIARTTGCGTWNGETALEKVVDMDKDDLEIGYKRILCFQITNESGAIFGRSVTKGHWIMHEYSLPGGGECVLCWIKRDDSKDTKISHRIGKNVEAATTDDDVVVPKITKHVRTGLLEEKKKWLYVCGGRRLEDECCNKGGFFVLLSNYTKERNRSRSFLGRTTCARTEFTMSNDPNELTVEEFVALWEEQENGETWLSAEPLGPSDQESDGFLSPNSMFQATAEPSPIISFSNEFFWGQLKNYMSQLDPEPYGGSKISHDGKRTSSFNTMVR